MRADSLIESRKRRLHGAETTWGRTGAALYGISPGPGNAFWTESVRIPRGKDAALGRAVHASAARPMAQISMSVAPLARRIRAHSATVLAVVTTSSMSATRDPVRGCSMANAPSGLVRRRRASS